MESEKETEGREKYRAEAEMSSLFPDTQPETETDT